jgi:hypothetical protein
MASAGETGDCVVAHDAGSRTRFATVAKVCEMPGCFGTTIAGFAFRTNRGAGPVLQKSSPSWPKRRDRLTSRKLRTLYRIAVGHTAARPRYRGY